MTVNARLCLFTTVWWILKCTTQALRFWTQVECRWAALTQPLQRRPLRALLHFHSNPERPLVPLQRNLRGRLQSLETSLIRPFDWAATWIRATNRENVTLNDSRNRANRKWRDEDARWGKRVWCRVSQEGEHPTSRWQGMECGALNCGAKKKKCGSKRENISTVAAG